MTDQISETYATGELVAEFWNASSEALFSQKTIAVVLCRSEAWCERARWAGTGPKFRKIGRLVLYEKSDVLLWLGHYPARLNTANNNEVSE